MFKILMAVEDIVESSAENIAEDIIKQGGNGKLNSRKIAVVVSAVYFYYSGNGFNKKSNEKYGLNKGNKLNSWQRFYRHYPNDDKSKHTFPQRKNSFMIPGMIYQ